MVIQLNQKKAELRQNSPAAGLEIEKPQQKFAEKDKISDGRIAMDRDEAEEQSKRYYKRSPAKAKKSGETERVDDLIAGEKAENNLRTSREEAVPKDAFAAGTVQEGRSRAMSDAESTVSKKEEAKPERASDKSGYARMDAPASAPRPAATAPKPAAPPAAMPAPTVADSRSQSGGNQNAQAEDAAPAEAAKNSRSIAVDDAKSRLKKQDIASDEKAEMEKLWKEFEQDPKSFNQDKKRSARLRTLLSRHNEKSRAKRMKAVETR